MPNWTHLHHSQYISAFSSVFIGSSLTRDISVCECVNVTVAVKRLRLSKKVVNVNVHLLPVSSEVFL